jgi:hypothetical protein
MPEEVIEEIADDEEISGEMIQPLLEDLVNETADDMDSTETE